MRTNDHKFCLFNGPIKRVEVLRQLLPGIEKGRALCLNPNPQPCGRPCPVTATPSLDLSGLAALAELGQGVCHSAHPHPAAPGTVYAVGT